MTEKCVGGCKRGVPLNVVGGHAKVLRLSWKWVRNGGGYICESCGESRVRRVPVLRQVMKGDGRRVSV